MPALLQQINDEMAAVIGEARKSLVQLRNGRQSTGAGTILHSDGLIVTNAHVLGRRSPDVVLWDGRVLPGRILATDRKKDLAIIAAETGDLPTIKLGNGQQVRPGQWVVALGHPWGITGACTAGMVIAVGEPVEQLPYHGELLQVGLQLRPGHSGGPMLDDNGRLIGINTMISGPGVGLAIPIHTVKRFLKKALGRGEPDSSAPEIRLL